MGPENNKRSKIRDREQHAPVCGVGAACNGVVKQDGEHPELGGAARDHAILEVSAAGSGPHLYLLLGAILHTIPLWSGMEVIPEGDVVPTSLPLHREPGDLPLW